jgi:hypothetical protein
LAALADRLPDQAPDVAAALLGALAADKDPGGFPGVAEALGDMSGRLTADQSARAVGALLDAVARPGLNLHSRTTVALALARLVERLPPEQADRAVRGALEALERAAGPDAQAALGRALARLAGRLTPDQTARAARALLDAAVKERGRAAPRGEPPAVEGLVAALADLAERCGPQTVVALLAEPTCIGEARDALRAVLGRRLGRSFAGQWEMVEWLRRDRPDLVLSTTPRLPDR